MKDQPIETHFIDYNSTFLADLIAKNNLSKRQHKFGTDKGSTHSYIKYFYQPFFDCVGAPKNILEIGTAGGASLALYKLAFPECQVTGCDIDVDSLHPICTKLLVSDNLKLVKGDAYSKDIFNTFGKNFDLIIDDGPHSIHTQIAALKYIEKLNGNGTLVIEDLGVTILTALRLKYSLPRKIRKNARYLSFVSKSGKFDDAIFVYSKNKTVLDFMDKLKYRKRDFIYEFFNELIRVFKYKINL